MEREICKRLKGENGEKMVREVEREEPDREMVRDEERKIGTGKQRERIKIRGKGERGGNSRGEEMHV